MSSLSKYGFDDEDIAPSGDDLICFTVWSQEDDDCVGEGRAVHCPLFPAQSRHGFYRTADEDDAKTLDIHDTPLLSSDSGDPILHSLFRIIQMSLRLIYRVVIRE
jgi:hypothetical protein